ncbi:MAG: hypothetical protein IPH75_10980 [bacterium]|nr:hypothetical protein [bacterium]
MLTVLGFHDLFFRSKAEKEYASISKIEDPESRNYETSRSLEVMAHDARKARLRNGIAFAILGGVQLAIAGGQSKENDGTQVFLAGSSFAVSLICLVVKSSAERTYDRFSREHGDSFTLAVGPSFWNGTPGLRACFSF